MVRAVNLFLALSSDFTTKFMKFTKNFLRELRVLCGFMALGRYNALNLESIYPAMARTIVEIARKNVVACVLYVSHLI